MTEYYNTLARTEQKAFDLALSGDDASRVTMTSYSGQKMQFPMTGCAAAARNLVYPDLEKFVRLGTLAEGLASEVDSRVAADPAYLDALAAWRACMSDKGFHYFKPADPRTEVANDYATMSHASAHAHEISIATADAECGQQVNLVKIADARWNSYEATFEKDHQGELLAWAQMQKQALATAKTLLAKG